MVVLAVVSVNLFGLRMIELTEPKMMAETEARRILDTFIDDVRGANSVEVPTGAGGKLEGNALIMEWWLTDRTNIIEYIFIDASNELIRSERVQGVAGTEVERLLAGGISSSPERPIFSCEDHTGIVLAEPQRRMIIAMQLEFQRLHPTEYLVGDNGRFADYQLRTQVAFRSH
jgi:hypothetical protein